MKKWQKIVAMLLSIVVICSYVGGILVQFIDPSVRQKGSGDAWTVVRAPVSFNPFKCMVYAFSNSTGITIVFLGIVMLGIVYLWKYFEKDGEEKKDERNFNISDKGSYGTSGWLEDEEAKTILEFKSVEKTDGTILGEKDGYVVSLPQSARLNKNMIIYGSPGAGKSRCFVRNQIIQCVKRGESVVITDPKGEMYRDAAAYLKDNGYDVKTFDLVDPKYSDSWNCLNEILSDPEKIDLNADIFCDIIIKNTKGVSQGESKKDFWDNAELNLLKAVCLYVAQCEDIPEEKRSLGTVYELISGDDAELGNQIETFISVNRGTAVAASVEHPWNIYKKAEKLSGQVIIGLGSRLAIFQNEIIKEITSYKEIDLSQPAKEKTALFVITSDQNSSMDFLSSLMFSFLFIRLVEYADIHGKNGMCDVPVNFILDEFPNIGLIPDFTKKLATVRSRDIRVAIIFQSLPLLQNRYPYGAWEAIIGSCDTQLFLGCNDDTTAKFISTRSGEMTIEVSSEKTDRTAIALTQDYQRYSQTSSVGKRYLLTPDEVQRLDLSKALIILKGHKIYKVDKYDFSKHPESKKFREENIRDYVPEWRANKEEAEADKKSMPYYEEKDENPEPEDVFYGESEPQNQEEVPNSTDDYEDYDLDESEGLPLDQD